jgi:mono/diheme cytochrome c family protein
MRVALIAVLVVATAGCALPVGLKSRASEPSPAAVVEDGRAIAEAQCAGCHAVGAFGASPRPDAPPFRTILTRYRADVLEEELDNGIKLGHPDMPRFQLNPQGASALLAYLRSIQAPPAAPKP